MRRLEGDWLIYEYKDRLYGLCLHLERDTYYAEELFQDTWVRALEYLDTYDTKQAFYPWLTKIAVNLYRDRLRRLKIEIKRRTRSVVEEGIEERVDSINTEKMVIERERFNSVQEHLQRLDSRYRVPLILFVLNELSYEEIAEVLGIKASTVKSRIYDGRQKLKKSLMKEGFYE